MRQAKQGIEVRRTAWRLVPHCALMAVAACTAFPHTAVAEDLSVFHPASQPAEAIRDLFYLVLGITGAIFVLVEGALIYSALRFRARRMADATPAEPAQVYGTVPLEVAWTVAPLLIVFVLFLVVVRSVVEAQEENDEGDAVKVTVIGHQWWWEVVYPGGTTAEMFTTANELHVPAAADGKPMRVEIALESADVVHSFWVPRLGGKTDLIPGRTNRMWFTCPTEGVYLGQCAEFCGMQHANMKLRVISEPAADFEAWQQNERLPAVHEAAVDAGRERFLSFSCVNCHTVRGTTARGAVGPDLTHLMARSTIASGAATNDRERLLQWIANPDAIKPGSQMPNLHLDPADVESIVTYLETLK